MSSTEVTVIIPAYNEEKHISRCVKSVRDQSEPPKEIIVVANGCVDNTVSIARGYGAQVIELSEKGVSKARNTGAKFANCNVLIFIDADTIMEKNMVKLVKQSIRKGYVGGVCKIHGDSKSLKSRFMWFLANIFNHFYKLPYGMMFCRAKSFQKFREDLIIGEDAIFLRRLSKKGKIAYITKSYVKTSMRRYEKEGYLKTIVSILFGYFFRKNQKYKPIR